MRGLFSLVFSLTVVSGLTAQGYSSVHFEYRQLADGVFAAIHKTGGYGICNAGIVNLGKETLVFDCCLSPEAARDLKKAAEELTGNQVKYVVNSHYHNDHVRGNQVFTGARIIATTRTRALMEQLSAAEVEDEKLSVDERLADAAFKIANEEDTTRMNEHQLWLGYYQSMKSSHAEYKLTLPDYLVDDSLSLKGKKRSVQLISKGGGHSESDMIMWLPAEKILFAGDLVFIGFHPWFGEADIPGWLSYLQYMKRLGPAVVVPGHGEVGKSADIDEMSGYLTSVETILAEMVRNKIPVNRIGAIHVPEKYNSLYFRNFFTPGLTLQYQKKIRK
jgi:glyoxylase-like metal-dependent hydrolase (beta-lactamase superfamily II)